jgi:hypothetical protein
LIVVALIAAVCVGLAIWRLRRGGRDSGSVSGRTAEAKPNL